MAMEGMSWRGLFQREVGLPLLHLSPPPSLPLLGCQNQVHDVCCWQGVGSSPCPSQAPTMVCKEGWEARTWLGN